MMPSSILDAGKLNDNLYKPPTVKPPANMK